MPMRQLVDAPSFVARNYGLLSVVQPRYDVADEHWRNGVTYQPLCGNGGSTFDSCAASGNPTPILKVQNVLTPLRGATPFTVYGEWDCSPVGWTQEEMRQKAITTLIQGESWQVERSFWTGNTSVTGGPGDPGAVNIALPHLAANANIFDTSTTQRVLLQSAAALVTGSTVVDVVEGIGYLEAALYNCNNGHGVIHIPVQLAEELFRSNAVRIDGGVVKTMAGNLVAFGAGYTGSGPDGTLIPGALWIYATGQIFAYRSPIESFRFDQMFDKATNTVRTIAERTYVLGWDCCHIGVPVSVGGIVTGIVGSPL